MDDRSAKQGHAERRIGRIDVADVTQNNVGQLRKLNAVLFPVRFGERWYRDVLAADVSPVCKFALYNDLPVANVCCRFEPNTDGAGPSDAVDVYIMTLGCLAPYRRLGIGKTLLQHILTVAGPGKTVERPAPGETEVVQVGITPKKTKDDKAAKTEERKTIKSTVRSVYLHVQTSNDEARAFYESQGFQMARQIDEYYKLGISPRSAWLLEKR